jgi:hypothetical protein
MDYTDLANVVLLCWRDTLIHSPLELRIANKSDFRALTLAVSHPVAHRSLFYEI